MTNYNSMECQIIYDWSNDHIDNVYRINVISG